MCLIIHLRVATRERFKRERERGLEIETESLYENTWHISRQFSPLWNKPRKGWRRILASSQTGIIATTAIDKVPKWVRFVYTIIRSALWSKLSGHVTVIHPSIRPVQRRLFFLWCDMTLKLRMNALEVWTRNVILVRRSPILNDSSRSLEMLLE